MKHPLKLYLRVLMLGMAAAWTPLPAAADEAADIQALKARVTQLERAGDEWKETDSVVHLAGYGAVGYSDVEGQTGEFDTVSYNPIFHYQFDEKVLLEAELEMEIDEAGETEIALEYATIDWLINDHVALVAGKFLSPVGYFRQNLHPAWINKLASAPVGFGHGGAAPSGDIGLQLRGGFNGGETARFNYAVYVGNGPELEVEDGEIHGVEAEGVARDVDGKRVAGGRLGFLPVPGLELGVSFASGDTSIVADDGVDVEGDPARSYQAKGFDAAYRLNKAWEFRGEWISQEIGAAEGSLVDEAGKWEAWYAQVTHTLFNKWEIVLRAGEFTPPEQAEKREQTALGINYLITPSAMIKLAFESNDAETGSAADRDRTLLQFAYGF